MKRERTPVKTRMLPGAYAGRKWMQTVALGAAGGGWIMGLACGLLAMQIARGQEDGTWWWLVPVFLVGVVTLMGLALWKGEKRMEQLIRGQKAEMRTAQIIEFALSRTGCASAHSVTELGTIGDIDHLVATPGGLWVVETKSARVPKKYFGRTLRRIAANVQVVRTWAGEEIRVRGCLVIAEGTKTRIYETDGVPIQACSQAALGAMIREEARNAMDPRQRDAKLANRIWKISGAYAGTRTDKLRPRDETAR